MRKNAKKFIELKCKKCGNLYQKELKEYTRRTKLGKKPLYCSLECQWADGNNKINELTPFRLIMANVRKRWFNRGKEVDIDEAYLKNLWEFQNGVCPYTHKKMVLHHTQERHFPDSASLDRIDSSKGYIKDNVEFVCLFINYGKNGFSKQQVKDFLAQ